MSFRRRVVPWAGLALLYAGLATWGCATVDVCEAGDPCLCRGAFSCNRECSGPECDFRCISFGACFFDCPDGQCTAECDSEGACTMDCQGGGCAMSCKGAGACKLICPNQDCSLECDGNTGACEEVLEDVDPRDG